MSDRERRRRDDDEGDRGRERSRDRGDDRAERRPRDDDDRGRERSRSRDDDRGSERSRDRDDDRGGRSGGRYEYERRDPDKARQRGEDSGDFDRFLKPGTKVFKPRDGENRVRLMPPGWKPAEHYGYDIWVHYGVGADRGTYLDLQKMKHQPDPIDEERQAFARQMDADDEKDKAELRELSSTKRVLVYLIDRDAERDGVQAWAMPKGLDSDIVKVSQDRDTGEVLAIDHPKDGFDVYFTKTGAKKNTKYEGVSIARRPSALHRDDDRMEEWLDLVQSKPLPDQLVYYDYEHIARAFGGKGSHKGGTKDRDDDRGRDRDDDRRGGRERDDDRGSERSRDRDDDRREKSRSADRDEPTWDSVHAMTGRELEDLIELEKLDINPKDAKDDDDLADWVCEEMKITKRQERRREEPAGDGDMDGKLAKMRERRRDRD